MDLLDELTLDDVTKTAAEEVLKKAEVDDVDEYPVRIDCEVRVIDHQEGVRQRMLDVLDCFSQYIEHSDIIIYKKSEEAKTMFYKFGLVPHFFTAHQVCNFLYAIRECLYALKVTEHSLYVTHTVDESGTQEMERMAFLPEKIKRINTYKEFAMPPKWQWTSYNRLTDADHFKNICRAFNIKPANVDEYVHDFGMYERLMTKTHKYLKTKVKNHQDLWGESWKENQRIKEIHDNFRLDGRVMRPATDFQHILDDYRSSTSIWLTTLKTTDFSRYKIGQNSKAAVSCDMQYLQQRMQSKTFKPCPKISWSVMRTGAHSSPHVRSVIYLGEMTQRGDLAAMGAAVSIVAPLDSYEEILRRIFPQRKINFC